MTWAENNQIPYNMNINRPTVYTEMQIIPHESFVYVNPDQLPNLKKNIKLAHLQNNALMT